MAKNSEKYTLSLLSLIFLALGYLVPGFPFLIVLSLAPLFRQHLLFREEQLPFRNYFLYIAGPLSVGFLIISLLAIPEVQWFHGLFHGIVMSLSFFIFWLTDRHARNRLGFFTMLIYWLAMEYVTLKIFPGAAWFLLGSTFTEYPGLIAWNAETGIMGVSALIILANILLYYVFFRAPGILEGTFRPLSLAYSLILLAVPAIISWQFYDAQQVITPADAMIAYSDSGRLPEHFTAYGATGEVFGRTAAWVSVLLILYSLVKRKVNK